MNELSLRPMTMEDADKMLEWKNYPETRKFAITSHDEIKKEDHYRWLEKNLQYFSIIREHEGGVSLGAIRMQNQEISIWVDQAFRNQGIAKKTLKLISAPGMTAKIVEGNLPSMRAFIFAGFSPVEYVSAHTPLSKEMEAAYMAPAYYIFKKL